SIDGGDRELVEVPHREIQRLRKRAQAVVRAGRVVVSRGNVRDERPGAWKFDRATGDVVARAERSTGAGEHDDADRVVHLCLEKRLDQVALQVARHTVQSLGAIE